MRRPRRRPNIQIQAILGRGYGFSFIGGAIGRGKSLNKWTEAGGILYARAARLRGIADTGPRRRRLRLSPAEITDGRRGIRNPFEDSRGALKISAQTPAGKVHNRSRFGSSRENPSAGQQERQDKK